ncbi:MAG TPA: hypothetical protein VK857_00070, partial [Desulforhopalus sp.]|nr:hypothetical protein [Desulforhopalus sp.]
MAEKSALFETDRSGWQEHATFILAIGVSLLHIYFNLIALLPSLWQNALHFAGFALLCSLTIPLGGPRRKWRWLLAVDLLLGIAAATSAIYMISMEDAIYARGMRLATGEWIA